MSLLGTPIGTLGTPPNVVACGSKSAAEDRLMRVQLTDRFCASAKASAVQTDYFDAAVTGLALRVTAGGP